MPDEPGIERGIDESAVIERVVPGKLVYVTTTSDPSRGKPYTFVFKLDQLVIRKSDGSCRPYRGEPLSEWNIHRGAKVVVWGITNKTVKPALVIDADRPREFSVSNTISNVVISTTSTIGKLFGDR
jgi:hypothetical protein